MADQIELKRQIAFSLGHICSRCGNPVVNRADLCVKVFRVNSALSHSRLDPSRVAELQIVETLDQIKKCKLTQQVLGALESERGDSPWVWGLCTKKVDSGTSVSVWAHHISEPCPCCGHVEVWQKREADNESLKDMLQENYPELFTDEERATLWARLILLKQMEKIMLLSDEDKLCTQKTYDHLREEKERLSEEYQDPGRKADLAKLQRKTEELNSDIKKAGLFASKKKMALKEELDETERKFRTALTETDQKDKELKDGIELNALRMIQLEKLLYGSSGIIELDLSSHAEAYRLCSKKEELRG